MKRTVLWTRPRSAGSVARARVALLLSALVLAGVAPASAQDDPPEPGDIPEQASFAVQPSGPDGPGSRDYFVYTLGPGETFGDTVAVSNLSERPINFLIYPADAFDVPDEGGFTAARDGEEPIDAGSWITLGTDSHRVEPGERIDVPFKITIPDDAEPGDHAAAILATDADRASVAVDEDGEPNLQVRQRVGARVYVRVEGPVSPALRIDRLYVDHSSPSFAVPIASAGGTADITWEVTNTGNVRLAPSAVLEVKGLFGRTIKTLPAEQLPELLPGSNIVRSTSIDGLPPLEKITVELTVTAPEARVVGTSSYWAVPWLFLALLAVAAIIGFAWRRRRKRRGSQNRGPTPPRQRERQAVPA